MDGKCEVLTLLFKSYLSEWVILRTPNSNTESIESPAWFADVLFVNSQRGLHLVAGSGIHVPIMSHRPGNAVSGYY